MRKIISNEFIAQFQFIRQHLTNLKSASLKQQNLSLRQIMIWIVTLIALANLVTVFTLLPTLAELPFNLIYYLSLILSPIINSLALNLLLAVGLGFWVMHDKDYVKWTEWVEFYYLCRLPVFLSSFLSFIPAIGQLITISANAFSIYLFYNGLKFRYWHKNHGHLYLCIVILVLINILPMFLSINSSFSKLLPSGINSHDLHAPQHEKEWTPELPDKIINQINNTYSDTKKQKAAMQFAHALWLELNPNWDKHKDSKRTFRAMDCLAENNMMDDSDQIESLVLYKYEYAKISLEHDSEWDGQVIPFSPPGKDACD
ncbi:MAG: hypothetical protein KDD38_08705 [Bdellovibrionales bacterium]|nr:hypothetical protein [Bdellovibrionales bacterium]